MFWKHNRIVVVVNVDEMSTTHWVILRRVTEALLYPPPPPLGNVYWIDSFAGSVEVVRLDGSHRALLYQQDGSKPSLLATHPNNGSVGVVCPTGYNPFRNN